MNEMDGWMDERMNERGFPVLPYHPMSLSSSDLALHIWIMAAASLLPSHPLGLPTRAAHAVGLY